MSKLEEKLKSVKAVKEEPTAPVLTHDALGMFKNEPTGQWFVAHIRYNPNTLEAKVETKFLEMDRATAVERFKILTTRLGVI